MLKHRFHLPRYCQTACYLQAVHLASLAWLLSYPQDWNLVHCSCVSSPGWPQQPGGRRVLAIPSLFSFPPAARPVSGLLVNLAAPDFWSNDQQCKWALPQIYFHWGGKQIHFDSSAGHFCPELNYSLPMVTGGLADLSS